MNRRRTQELCESRGGHPGLPVHNNPYGLCGRKATLNYLRVSNVLLPPVAQAISPVYYRFAACVWHSDRMVYVYASHVNRSRRVTLQNWICVLSAGASLLFYLSVCLSVSPSVCLCQHPSLGLPPTPVVFSPTVPFSSQPHLHPSHQARCSLIKPRHVRQGRFN